MDRIAQRRAGALALLLGLMASCCHAADAPAPGGSFRPPHLLTPDAPLFPDYYALALEHTSIKDDPTWRPLHLQAPPAPAAPAVIILPVQTQAYGFAPMFRSLLGARLDQELQRRHIDATRQTDIVDWRGPFVRRSDDATVAALAADHPGAALLTLYVGHDAQGHAFLTLARADGAKVRLAHRRVDIPQQRIATLDAFTRVLPPLLAELGLGDPKPAPALSPGHASGCDIAQWNLDDVPLDATPVATACHALLMGTLMPDFLSRVTRLTQPNAPDRLAWLARAWVEADALASTMPAMRAAATLASLQLRLDEALQTSASLVDDHDDVVRPLARLLWAREHAAGTPQRSRNDAVDSYMADALAGLPPFATAVMVEHARFTENFREVDLCPMQLALPYFKKPAGCEDEPGGDSRPRQRASRGQLQLVDDWRVAAAWNALHVEGQVRGSAPGLARVLHDMPPRIAAHPIVRTMRYAMSSRETQAVGAQPHLLQTRARTLDYAEAIATLQREDVLIREHNIAVEPTLELDRDDPSLAHARDDVLRLESVWEFDIFAEVQWQPVLPASPPATFMAEGNFAAAARAGGHPAARTLAVERPPGSQPAPDPAAAPHLVTPVEQAALPPSLDPPPTLPSKNALLQALESNPGDMRARVALALVGLEHGAGVAEARRLIDARPAQPHVEDTVGEANGWAVAAHMFYFAGQLDAARFYYAKAASFGTGSESDLIARVRVAAIDGDVRGAFERTRQRVKRYGGENAIADEAGYLFMLHRPVEAWQLIVPRLQTSTDSPLWRSALAGHRIAGDHLDKLPAWVQQNQLERVRIDWVPAAPFWLFNYAVVDRVPTPADMALLRDAVRAGNFGEATGGALVVRSAIDPDAAAAPSVLSNDLVPIFGGERDLLRPFYAWALWNANGGRNAQLDEIRKTPLESGFQAVLAKAMVLAADGRREEALGYMTAARWELGRNGGAHAFRDRLRTAPYDFVLASWLMTRKTGDRAYAEQGLAIATAYQHVVQYMAWPYAAEALLGRDPKAREIAACRALALDAGSMFLHESGLHPDPGSPVCLRATAW